MSLSISLSLYPSIIPSLCFLGPLKFQFVSALIEETAKFTICSPKPPEDNFNSYELTTIIEQ